MRSRREFLQAITISATGLATGCAAHIHVAATAPAALGRRRAFAPVLVSPDRVIRTVVGLRPFRPSGFVVRAEKMGEKIVIHNYGHGGGGMTLSWGTSQLAVEMLPAGAPSSVAVLGCGGVGLATARLLQRRGAAVTIYAKNLPPDTTSNISGAQWSPVSVFDDDRLTPAFRDQFARAARIAYRQYQNMLGDYYGVRWIPNYILSDQPIRNSLVLGADSPIRDLYPESHDLAPGEHPFDAKYVQQFDTMLIEPPVYLNAMLRDFLIAGGKVVVREFEDVPAVLALPEPIVMNCTGLGAGKLFNDQEITPIKGQLTVLLPQPEVDYNVLAGRLYMFPRRDGILLGGTHERGEWSLDPNLTAQKEILEGHQRLFSAMRSA